VKQVILYTKPGCHLCDPVRELILSVQRHRPFEFSIRNIEDNPADFEKYQHAIPVVLVDGREIARYKLSQQQLEAALGSEQT
jgi:glutaredoxin